MNCLQKTALANFCFPQREYVERIILVGVLEQSSCHAQHQTPEASSFAKAFFLWSIGKDLLWLTLAMESVVGLVSEGTCSSPLGWNLYKGKVL